VALEPANWRHFFRLGHASWGEERLRAAVKTLALYPDFAFGFFQIAMVHVARGLLREAETVLRQGAAVQDRQLGRGERYPALGLHWLLGLVRLAQDDGEEALREFERELALAAPHRLYGREYEMNATHARGACLLRLGRHHEARDAFQAALALYPGHAQSHLGLALAWRALGAPDKSAAALDDVRSALNTLTLARPIEASMVRAQLLAAEDNVAAGSSVLCDALDAAPPGFACWTIPVDPLLRQLLDSQSLTDPLTRLAGRAR
jgi:tetratricopeptide (TPR) repeat protein